MVAYKAGMFLPNTFLNVCVSVWILSRCLKSLCFARVINEFSMFSSRSYSFTSDDSLGSYLEVRHQKWIQLYFLLVGSHCLTVIHWINSVFPHINHEEHSWMNMHLFLGFLFFHWSVCLIHTSIILFSLLKHYKIFK